VEGAVLFYKIGAHLLRCAIITKTSLQEAAEGFSLPGFPK